MWAVCGLCVGHGLWALFNICADFAQDYSNMCLKRNKKHRTIQKIFQYVSVLLSTAINLSNLYPCLGLKWAVDLWTYPTYIQIATNSCPTPTQKLSLTIMSACPDIILVLEWVGGEPFSSTYLVTDLSQVCPTTDVLNLSSFCPSAG